MDNYGHHFISLKFLTAIILGLFFAFLLIYVFSPESELNYSVYSFEREDLTNISHKDIFTEKEKRAFFNDYQKEPFKFQLKEKSFKIMTETKKALLAVITANHFEEINIIFEKERAVLNELRLELEKEREKLLQEKRKELEADLSNDLQQLRQKIRGEYSDFNQQDIKANYLQIINLKIAVEILAKNETEKENYQNKLEKVRAEQNKLLAEKNTALNEEISAETRTLIMDFNSRYSKYRDQIDSRQQKVLRDKTNKIEQRLSRLRKQIKLELKNAKDEKNLEIEKLITEEQKYY